MMQGVLLAKGLFSLPSNPRLKAANPSSHGLRQRISAAAGLTHLTKPHALPGKLALHSNGFQKFNGFLQKNQGFERNPKTPLICRAEAAAAAASPSDGQPLFGESESPKFLGIELNTIKKIIPLGLMFFCILFNYTILRDTKDVLVVTAKGSSAEIIPFLKTWVNLPMAVGFMLLYTKLANVLSKKALSYTTIVPFIAFFGAFGFVLYPMSHYFHNDVSPPSGAITRARARELSSNSWMDSSALVHQAKSSDTFSLTLFVSSSAPPSSTFI